MAKKKQALKALNAQFAKRQVRKTYLAIVSNPPPQKAAILTHWLRKDTQNKRALISANARKGSQEVRLHYRLLGNLDHRYLLEVHPMTGKFHQIRAQLSLIKCPIVGDTLYGGEAEKEQGIGLHALKLRIVAPDSGEVKWLEADLPEAERWEGWKVYL